jgi:hypothetical protein
VALELALAQNPTVSAVALRRQERALSALADEFEATAAALSDGSVNAVARQIAEAVRTAEAAALSAQERFFCEPIPGTGQATWASLYKFARQFAADGGVRTAAEPMEAGDPCPYCQRDIDGETAARLRRFDDYIQSVASIEAAASAAALAVTAEQMEAVQISDGAAVAQAIGEYRDLGEAEAEASQRAAGYAATLLGRKAAIVAGIYGRALEQLEPLSVEDADYQVIFAAMSRVSEYSGHDMAARRQIPVPDQDDMRRDLENLDQFRLQIHRRKNGTRDRRAALEGPPPGQVA